MKQLKIVALVAALCLCFWALPAEAQGVWGACTGQSSAICADKSEGTALVTRLINFFLSLIGIIAVIMIIHSGLKYVTSRGDAEQIKSAKNTLLYAIVGLVVAILSFVIVNFVIGAVKPEASSTAMHSNGKFYSKGETI